jgi:hypothetical protein
MESGSCQGNIFLVPVLLFYASARTISLLRLAFVQIVIVQFIAYSMTASVVWWSEFLATGPGSILGATRFSEKYWNGVHSAS